ncbi:MAG: HD domain-containing protein [Rhodospirillales bacterium]|nr:HD domain-containing protein [Rhodospirillales bacterium]
MLLDIERDAGIAAPALRLADIIATLSYALDLTEGQPPGHCLRATLIGMRLGRRLCDDPVLLGDLYYTLLLKDAGCSSNAARLWALYGGDERLIKHDFKTVDSDDLRALLGFVLRHAGSGEAWRLRARRLLHLARHGEGLATELIQTRCERGAGIVTRLGFPARVAAGVHALDEHWNGKGKPLGLQGEAIPWAARIALLAQVADVFHCAAGPMAARAEIARRSGTWFDPAMAAAFAAIETAPGFWEMLDAEGLGSRVTAIEPQALAIPLDEDRLDVVAEGFADVIDAKSAFTSGHSRRVTFYADRIAERLGLTDQRRRWLRRAGLLHDIGKLGVSTGVLDKPGRLGPEEWTAMRRHASLTEDILVRLPVFRGMAAMAGAHHERLDGKGYPKGLQGEQIGLETRILTTGDIFDALTAERPYRAAMPSAQALAIMQADLGTAIDPACFAALQAALPAIEQAGGAGAISS